jgi:predicted nucleic acid-binding protein
MRALIDTSVAILLRDGDEAASVRTEALPTAPSISVVTRVELEGGVYREGADRALLRQRLDAFLGIVDELPFTSKEAEVYGQIAEQRGYSRRQIFDRMIVATAIVAGATLITLNPSDFRGIAGLTVEDWTR